MKSNKSVGPDFLVIGAGRAGTTWLFQQLQKIAEVWVPPTKELHYFDRNPIYKSPSFLASSSAFIRLFSLSPTSNDFRRKAVRYFARSLAACDMKDLVWGRRYYLSTVTDEWYLSLFDFARPVQVKGELTPAYQLLRLDDIMKMEKLLGGDLKIIFILRDPVERSRSQLKKVYPNASLQNLSTILHEDDMWMRNDFVRTSRDYIRAFGSNRVFHLFYDDLMHDPLSFLMNFLSIIGLESVDVSRVDIRKTNSSSESGVESSDTLAIISQVYEPLLQAQAEYYGGYAINWWMKAKSYTYE